MITVPHLHEGLLALEEFYRDKKYDVHLRQPHKGWSSMEKGDHKIPFRYDYTNGGFHMDYIPRTQLTHKDNYSTPNKGVRCNACAIARYLGMHLRIAQNKLMSPSYGTTRTLGWWQPT